MTDSNKFTLLQEFARLRNPNVSARALRVQVGILKQNINNALNQIRRTLNNG